MTDKLITSEEVRKHFDNHKQQLEDYYGPFEDDDIDLIDNYIAQQEQFAKDVARYFNVIEVFDKYKREHPDKTDEEIKEVLKDEVNTYRELHKRLSKGVAK